MGIIHTARKSVKTELIRKHTILKKQEIGCAEAKYRDLSRKETMEVNNASNLKIFIYFV